MVGTLFSFEIKTSIHNWSSEVCSFDIDDIKFLWFEINVFPAVTRLMKNEIYITVLRMFFEFQYSLWLDGKSNHLQKFDKYNRGLRHFLMNKNNCISYYNVKSLESVKKTILVAVFSITKDEFNCWGWMSRWNELDKRMLLAQPRWLLNVILLTFERSKFHGFRVLEKSQKLILVKKREQKFNTQNLIPEI